MSDEEGGADKEHEPTQKKLDDARKKGEVPKSADLTTAAGYAGVLTAALAFGSATFTGLGNALTLPLDRADTLATAIFGEGSVAGSSAPLFGGLIGAVSGPLAPWFLLPAALALLSILAQKGFVVAPSKIAPKLSRISPLSTAKQKFGREGLFEFAKSTAKLMIYGTILGVFVWSEMPRILGTLRLPPALVSVELGQITLQLMWMVVIVSATIGVIDMVWQQAEHQRKNRMSRKELRDEMKESEGDPQMKGQRRQRAVSLAMNQMLADVPKADVVIVNPTHYAVALKWDRMRGSAPVCVAKGVDETARQIRELAAEHGVPVHSDPPTARALYAGVGIGDEVGTDHYRAVAAAIRFADRIRQKGR